MSTLQRALKELESATAAVAATHHEDFAEAKAAMDRRHWAIADVAEFLRDPASLPAGEREETLRRLQLALETGNQARERLVEARGATVAEWTQWSRIYRSLSGVGVPTPTRVDCRG